MIIDDDDDDDDDEDEDEDENVDAVDHSLVMEHCQRSFR